MLTYDPKKRISAAESLDHPWFSNNVSEEPLHTNVLKILMNFQAKNKFK